MSEVKRMTTINVDSETVDVTRNTKTSKGGKQYQCHWVLDYSGVTKEQLLSLATRGIVIDKQREFRDAKPSERGDLAEQTIDVGAFLAETKSRKPADPRAAALKLLAGMNPDEIEALVTEAQA